MNINTLMKRKKIGDSHLYDRWSKNFPPELLEIIVKRLGLFELMSCTAVCWSWNHAAVALKPRRFDDQFPCILRSVPYHPDWFSLYSPAENRDSDKFRVPIDLEVVPHRGDVISCCSGYCGSWLIIAELPLLPSNPSMMFSKNHFIGLLFKCYFFNPVSGAQIPLQPLQYSDFSEYRKFREKQFIRTVASSPDPTDPNCIVAATMLDSCRVAFCIPNGIDASWTFAKRAPYDFLDGGWSFTGITGLNFHKGMLYATMGRKFDAVAMFDPVDVFTPGSGHRCKILEVSPFYEHAGIRWEDMHRPSFSLITSARGELLLVLKEKRNDTQVLFSVLRCEVMRDARTNRISELKYEVVNDIGEEAIFVSNTETTFMAMGKPITNSMPVRDELGGRVRRNCIYFTNECDDRIGVYDIADGTLNYYLSHGLTRSRCKVWITPDLTR